MSTLNEQRHRPDSFVKARRQFLRSIELLVEDAGSDLAFCKKAGIKRSSIDNWRRNSDGVHGPSAHHLLKISKAFGVTVDWLLLGDQHASRRIAAPEVTQAALHRIVGATVVDALVSGGEDAGAVAELVPNPDALGDRVLAVALEDATAEAWALIRALQDARRLRWLMEVIPKEEAWDSTSEAGPPERVREINAVHRSLRSTLSRSIDITPKIWAPSSAQVPDARVLLRKAADPPRKSHRQRVQDHL